jgi:hypothetical protein
MTGRVTRAAMRHGGRETMQIRSSYVGVADGAPFLIDGINVWDHAWEDVPGDFATVRDLLGKDVSLGVCRITTGSKTIRFAAMEVSACMWAFYLPEGHDFEAP